MHAVAHKSTTTTHTVPWKGEANTLAESPEGKFCTSLRANNTRRAGIMYWIPAPAKDPVILTKISRFSEISATNTGGICKMLKCLRSDTTFKYHTYVFGSEELTYHREEGEKQALNYPGIWSSVTSYSGILQIVSQGDRNYREACTQSKNRKQSKEVAY